MSAPVRERSRLEPVVLADERLELACVPEQGATVTALVDRASGVDALWHRPHVPAPCSRALGAPGPASDATFSDVWVGGWSTCCRSSATPRRTSPTRATCCTASSCGCRGSACGWVTRASRARSTACGSRCASSARSKLDGTGGARIDTLVINIGAQPVPYSWGLHPCFDRAVFAGGRIEADVASARVPEPAYAPGFDRLPVGVAFDWPHVGEPPIDVAEIPAEPTGSHDHVSLTLRSGRVRVTAPRHRLALTLEYDVDRFPHLLLWQEFAPQAGWPSWGAGDVFALEPSTNPGRTAEEAAAAGAVRLLDAGAAIATSVRVRWGHDDEGASPA